MGPVRVPVSALDLRKLGSELAAVRLAGDGLTLRVPGPARSGLAISRDAVKATKEDREAITYRF